MSTDAAAPHDSGEQLLVGRYELGPVIGVGSSAVVHRGRDLQDGEPVAVKLFHPGASMHDRRQQRQEIAALAQLEHPGLVGLHDGGTEMGQPYVVTELVEGPTLAERIGDGPLSVPQLRDLGAQLADALAAVHAGGFVHRDIKPANVLLEDGHRPRLADFGIARALDATAATTAGCVLGTAAYLAPEQVRGEEIGPAADIYALGLVLLEAHTGRREYPGSALESATSRLYRKPALPDELPSDLSRLLGSMTAADPAERPGAGEVAGLLARRPAADLVVDASGSMESQWGRRSRHRRLSPGAQSFGVPMAAAAVLVLAFVIGVLTLLNPADPTSTLVPVPMSAVNSPGATFR